MKRSEVLRQLAPLQHSRPVEAEIFAAENLLAAEYLRAENDRYSLSPDRIRPSLNDLIEQFDNFFNADDYDQGEYQWDIHLRDSILNSLMATLENPTISVKDRKTAVNLLHTMVDRIDIGWHLAKIEGKDTRLFEPAIDTLRQQLGIEPHEERQHLAYNRIKHLFQEQQQTWFRELNRSYLYGYQTDKRALDVAKKIRKYYLLLSQLAPIPDQLYTDKEFRAAHDQIAILLRLFPTQSTTVFNQGSQALLGEGFVSEILHRPDITGGNWSAFLEGRLHRSRFFRDNAFLYLGEYTIDERYLGSLFLAARYYQAIANFPSLAETRNKLQRNARNILIHAKRENILAAISDPENKQFVQDLLID